MKTLPRPPWEHIIPLPDPDYSVSPPAMTFEEFTSLHRWFVFPVEESGFDTFIKCHLISLGRREGYRA